MITLLPKAKHRLIRWCENEVRRAAAVQAARSELETACRSYRAGFARSAEEIAGRIEATVTASPGRCHCAYVTGRCGWCWRVFQARLCAAMARAVGGLAAERSEAR